MRGGLPVRIDFGQPPLGTLFAHANFVTCGIIVINAFLFSPGSIPHRRQTRMLSAVL